MQEKRHEAPEPPEPPEPPATRRRPKTVGDMVRSLAVVLAIVLVVVALTFRDDPEQRVDRLDYGAALSQARDRAPYDVLAPVGLPRSWRATSARGDQAGVVFSWHLGLVTPSEDFAEVEQSNDDPERMLAAIIGDGTPAGRTRIAGEQWRRVENGSPERRALVLDGDAVTTVVAGGAPWSQLRRLARSLSAG